MLSGERVSRSGTRSQSKHPYLNSDFVQKHMHAGLLQPTSLVDQSPRESLGDGRDASTPPQDRLALLWLRSA